MPDRCQRDWRVPRLLPDRCQHDCVDAAAAFGAAFLFSSPTTDTNNAFGPQIRPPNRVRPRIQCWKCATMILGSILGKNRDIQLLSGAYAGVIDQVPSFFTADIFFAIYIHHIQRTTKTQRSAVRAWTSIPSLFLAPPLPRNRESWSASILRSNCSWFTRCIRIMYRGTSRYGALITAFGLSPMSGERWQPPPEGC